MAQHHKNYLWRRNVRMSSPSWLLEVQGSRNTVQAQQLYIFTDAGADLVSLLESHPLPFAILLLGTRWPLQNLKVSQDIKKPGEKETHGKKTDYEGQK